MLCLFGRFLSASCSSSWSRSNLATDWENSAAGGTSRRKEAPVGTMVRATLGLLVFILAFTFGLAAARFDTRRQVLLDEANAIGTTYLRAGMLLEQGDQVRALLRDYVGVRLDAVRSGDVTEGIRRSENIQQQLWAKAETVGRKNPNSIVVGLFVQSLNELIDLHAKRVQAAVRSREFSAVCCAEKRAAAR
jgi:hypothetical protein